MERQRILLAEDDITIADLVKRTLEEEEYEVTLAPDGATAWDYLERFDYAAAVLDIMLPHINGLELCKRTRTAGKPVPILLLTALGTTDNIVMGLDMGADDYLTKPFKIAELLARLRSLTRRNAGQLPVAAPKQEAMPENLLTQYSVVLNMDEKTVQREGVAIELTATEFRLLEYFLKNPRRVLSRMDILEQVWGYDFAMNTKVVDVYVNYLRKKLDTPFEQKLIHTIIGMGYIFKEQ
ncbi:response regulator transcription factor [Niabella beijingensis]|uniref:response regulator transcription factor n=1 Tax=Niabella beijingensis TaxID=2872700 RepID=UPI001CBB82C9|nr:response regulator transcription factor [Niabella beijingensis]MBZ4188423.1 response regulator transcription factor [Niabella beijingensis]